MEIHIGDYSFRASQLEKCVAAMCSMWRRKPGAPELEVSLSYRWQGNGGFWHCRVCNTGFCGPAYNSGPWPSPWKALCGVIRGNHMQFKMWGITLEEKD